MGTLNPLNVFPLEVWKIIFENLGGQDGSSTNLWNCSKVCSVFEKTLTPTQSQWLFELVFPQLFPYMERKQILSCRRICKEWCRVVDSFLENFETRRPFNRDTTKISYFFEDITLEEKGLEGIQFFSVKDVTEFTRNMKNLKNPFPGGSLWLHNRRSPDPESDSEDVEMNNDEPHRLNVVGQNLFLKKVSKFLESFGERVKYIKLSSYKYDSLPVNGKVLYEFLRQYISCLPNLRELDVAGHFPYFNEDPEENRTSLRQLKQFLESDSSSLPEISSLESLSLSTFGLPRCINEKLIGSINPRMLKCLKLSIDQLNVEGPMLNFIEPLRSLTELHLLRMKSFEQFQNYLTNLVSVDAPLGKLKLSFYRNPDDPPINFDRVCEAISKFGRTLKMLSVLGLESPNALAGIPHDSYLSMLAIPHVQSLELDSVTFGPGPVLLPPNFAQSLEYLKILISYSDIHFAFSGRQGRGTEFFKGAIDGELCYSPIWSMVPKLKGIKVYRNRDVIEKVFITCTREMHARGVKSVPLPMYEFYPSSDSSDSDYSD